MTQTRITICTLSTMCLIFVCWHSVLASDVALTSFEDSLGGKAWSNGTVVSRHATDGKMAFQIAPGTSSTWQLDGDWSDYRHLKIDIYNPGFVVSVGFHFTDARGQSIQAFEYNIYSGCSTQHIRIDGLANDFGIGQGIDVSKIVKMDVHLSRRWQHDPAIDGIYIDNLRLSNDSTEPYREINGGGWTIDPLMTKPDGFLLPEFPGFELGYHTFAIDPAGYQLLSLPGSGRNGKGRSLELKPLSVDRIKIWDSARTFPKAGTYVAEFWARGPQNSRFLDHSGQKSFDLSPQWRKFSYEFRMSAGGARRFVLEVENLQGQSAWLDDFVVYRKDDASNLEPVSRAKGAPSVVTYADGICYINGSPTFLLGFLRGDPELLKGTPFNFCAPHELLQPEVEFLDRCAEYGIWSAVNLTSAMRSIAPGNAAYFAEKYKKHPALFSYYLCDEPDHSSPSATAEAPILARATQLLHAADPNHLTQALVIPWCASNIYRYRDTVDILSADRYAVQGIKENNELWTVYRANMAMKQSAVDGEVNIFTPLARDNITREENWAQAYMCVAAGAGGIMWFHFDGAQTKWNDFLELGNELRSIEEFLIGVELQRGLRFENDVLAKFSSGKTVHRDFKQIRGIGRTGVDRTALITVNITPHPAKKIKIIAPFLAHAKEAIVMFENRKTPITRGIIVDDYAGLERHVYVVDGLPKDVKPRPVPAIGGPHVTNAGAAWRRQDSPDKFGRSTEQIKRDRFKQIELEKADRLIENGNKQESHRVLQHILDQYPDAQDIQERIRLLR